MNWLLITCFSLFLAFSSQAYSDKKKLIYVDTEGFPPFLYHTVNSSGTKTYSGINLEIMKKIMEPFDYDVDLQIKPAIRTFADLNHGRADIGYLFRGKKTLDKNEYPEGILYCKDPILDISVGLYSISNSKVHVDRLEDMQKYRVGGITIAPSLEDKTPLTKSNTQQIIRYGKLKQLLKALLYNRVDFIEAPQHNLIPEIFYEFSQGRELKWNIQTIRARYFLAISSATEQRESLKKRICQRAASLAASGELQSIHDNHTLPSGSQLLDLFN